MDQSQPSSEKINDAIEKVVLNAKQTYDQFAKQFFASVESKTFDQKIKLFEDVLNSLTNISKEHFGQILLQAEQKLENTSCIDRKQNFSLQMIYEITVNKERQKEYHQELINQWKKERLNFFVSQEQKYVPIINSFAESQDQDQDQLQTNFYDFSNLKKQQVYLLKRSFKQINQKFSQKRKQCPVIAHITQLQLTTLRVISIKYQLAAKQLQRYQVSAFELFKLVHNNKNLSMVTIKGVNVKLFQQFIQVMAESREQQKDDRSWMKEFMPLKSLELSIDASLQFNLSRKQRTLCAINYLANFEEKFGLLSDLRVTIRLGKWSNESLIKRDVLEYSLKNLQKIRKIKIKIQGDYCDEFDQSFNGVLVGLASFTEICKLQFFGIDLSSGVPLNRFLAMEEILRALFEKNTITHLGLVDCKSFPIMPRISTLEKISIWNTSFRKQQSFVSDLSRTNPSLRSINCQCIQQWRIEEILINQLQQLFIEQSYHIAFDIQSQSPSNIKHLRIYGSNIGNVGCLSLLFPKLVYLTWLDLSDIDFGHELLDSIPSRHLEQLYICNNTQIIGQGLGVIDKKWPYLRKLAIRDCPNLNEDGWSACQFKGMIDLIVDVVKGHQMQKQLRKRGIRVYLSTCF